MRADKRNLVLTGFMGTGKSTVARMVAARLGRKGIDMDDVLVERLGMSIAEAFERLGEAAFRAQERALAAELSQQEGLVIATGGGTLVDLTNRELLGANGCLVCLDGAPEELARRLEGDQSRPMLWGADPAHKLRELLAARRPAYAQVPFHIDTTALTLAEVEAEVLALFAAAPQSWAVKTPTGGYLVALMAGGLRWLGALLKAREVSSRIVVVSDKHVWPRYGEGIAGSLHAHGFNPEAVILEAGEEHKTLATVSALYDRFAAAGLDRSGAVVAVGGGVTTDMAGFAAATFMRGVPLVMVPTSLLGMVDASIGGKVAVDHPRGKNLIGAFVQPLFVMLDPETLATLPERELTAGMAEVIKAGIIADAELFAAFEPGAEKRERRWLVARAIQVKIDVVAEDPFEQGRRAVLNLGHTFAHAMEVLSGYTLAHGLAVSMGMAAAAHLAELRGVCTAQTRERIIAALAAQGLPTAYDAYSPGEVYRAMGSDKKRRGGTLRFILPRAIGQVVIDAEVGPNDVIAALERMRP